VLHAFSCRRTWLCGIEAVIDFDGTFCVIDALTWVHLSSAAAAAGAAAAAATRYQCRSKRL
jgi:hypothetical protein